MLPEHAVCLWRVNLADCGGIAAVKDALLDDAWIKECCSELEVRSGA